MSRRFQRILASTAFLLAVPVWNIDSAVAADIKVDPFGGTVIVAVKGTLELGDGDKFANAISDHSMGIVVFNSDGGNLFAGIQIGTIIRLRHFVTVVPDDVDCASACAFGWLGGASRFMGSRAHIGFHAAYVVTGGEPTETGVGNALVGAYLNRLGLSDRAIIYITQAHPSEMTWLTLEEARQNGIDVAVLDGARRPPQEPAPTNRLESKPFLDRVATQFLDMYFAHWSEGNTQALAYFDRTYATEVDFYGKRIGHQQLMEEKRKYTKRWPERVYVPRLETITIDCDPASSICAIKGIVAWDCRSATRHVKSVGTANFTMQIAISKSGDVQIVAEAGSVISREISR